ncbi:hypothetical protein CL654_00075 [bacterium]|nr:hypothetical protein [bacterium]|tara:strand:+ start:11010 stop:12893 length:1884 start_codon:yes stop_codon:yes gene_type:complete
MTAKEALKNFIHSGRGENSPEALRKLRLINTFSLVGVLSLLIFGAVNTVQGDIFLGIFEVLAGIVGIGNIVYLRKTHNVKVGGRVILALMVVILTILFFRGGLAGGGLFWFFTFPLLAFHLSKTKEGSRWIFLLVGILLIGFFVLPLLGAMTFERSFGSIFMFLMAFMAVTFLVYFYEKAGVEFRNVIEKQATTIQTVTKTQAVSKETIEEQEEKLVKQVTELENTRKAMLNLLEDLNLEKDKLSESKALDDAILSSVGNGLVVTDESGKVVVINKVALEFLGKKDKEISGKEWGDVIKVSKEDKVPLKKEELPYVQSMKEKKVVIATFPHYYFFENKDKQKVPVSITASPIIKNDKLLGSVVIFRDITNEIAIDKAKTEFVSLASHQLRTPLSAINWFTEMLISGDAGKLNKEQKKYAEEVYASSRRMAELVGALLNVSRLELGTFSVEPEDINLPEMVEDAVKEMTPLSEKKSITIQKEIEDNLPVMKADRKLIRIIFQNLISNAVKYTPEKGTAKVYVGVKKKGENIDGRTLKEDNFLFTVSDTGIGIPAEQREQVFTKLFRADNARKVETEGTGLGLYIIKSIIEQSGGEIWFHPNDPNGTTFLVLFPTHGMFKKQGTTSIGG